MMKYYSKLFSAFSLLLLCASGYTPEGNAQAIDPSNALEQGLAQARAKAMSCASWAENPYCEIVADSPRNAVLDTLQEIRTKYHSETNTFLNKNIARISGTRAKTDPQAEQKAAETNLWQVYLERKTVFYQYHAALMTLLSRATQVVQTGNNTSSLQGAFGENAAVIGQLQAERIAAQRALGLTLETYAQMRLLYPVHAKLEEFISKLNDLRDTWEKFVEQVARMPRKFLNAAKQM